MNISWHKGKPEGRLNYCFSASPYGTALLAWTDEGLCYLIFTDTLDDLKKRWPKAEPIAAEDLYSKALFSGQHIPLALYGTEFEQSVWKSLLQIPRSETRTYKQIAQMIGKPSAQRAVGSAIGRNPIGLLVPCHRVIRSDGGLGGYRSGLKVKKQILKSENTETK